MENSKKDLDIIRKGNKLIEAKYSLNLNQQRVLADLLPQIKPYDEEFKDYRVNIMDIAKKYGLEASSSVYEKIQKSIEEMVISPLVFTYEKDIFATAWLSSAKYRKGQGYADVSFHPDLMPLLLMLKAHYTEYPATAIQKFRCIYSFRFYEWLQLFKYKGNGGQFYRIFTIKEIREKMDIAKNSYKLFSDIRRKIIEPAIKDIDKHSDLHIVSIEYIKTGKAVSDIKITAEPKNQNNILLVSESNIKDNSKLIFDTNLNKNIAFDDLINNGIPSAIVEKIIHRFDEERIKRNVSYSLFKQKEGGVKNNFIGYVIKAIDEDWAKNWIDEEEIKNQLIQKKLSIELELEKQKKEKDAVYQKTLQERKKYFDAFNQQSETMQDFILDLVEEMTKKEFEHIPDMVKSIQKNRKDGNMMALIAKVQNIFLKALEDNWVVLDDFKI